MPFEFKEYYLDEWANMNFPVYLAEKLEEFEDFKRTLKQKSSSPFVKKQEFKSTEKNRRYEAPGKFEYNRKDKKFPASTNYKNITMPLPPSTNLFKDIKTALRKARKNSIYRRHNDNYSKRREREEPVCQPPCRLAFTERQEVNKQIEEWLNEGIIRPSSSEYASPIVMLKKKDGSSRMCIDYRKLNQKLAKDKYPLPLIEDVLDTLQEAKVYSTLDLRNGFFHVDVDEDCRKYTSFIVPDGQFEFNEVPFGLSASPGVFQRYVSSIFRDLTRKGIVISYLDDFVIPAKNEQEGLEKHANS
ncbi:hypothetical protein TNCV_2154991 [Trichonephila clavipes]|nr:hypothetical protein TNCV_2154991 [Trichonephila clavipes]